MDVIEKVASIINVKKSQVASVVDLLDGGSTIPFIARYRKEATGNLDEVQIRDIETYITRLRKLEERKTTVIESISEQGKMTPELQNQILNVETLTDLEDIYQPYRPKRRTRASMAREKGLAPLAEMIIKQLDTRESLEKIAGRFLNADVATIEDALAGARDIVAEIISDHSEVRKQVREKTMRWGGIQSSRKEVEKDPQKTFETYYEYEGSIERVKPHQILAMNRGEKEGVLRIDVMFNEKDWRGGLQKCFPPRPSSLFFQHLLLAGEDAASRLLLPSIERDIRQILTEKAEQHAFHVFASNLRALLSQPMTAGHVVMGIDPGFRTGCKVAVVDQTGKVLGTVTIYPHEPQKKATESLKILDGLIEKFGVTLISIGNGTASRETEMMIAKITKQREKVFYVITSEAGASVYSASPLAGSELPDLDVSMRGAVSIARRVLDPLAELVKIDPKSIGVGMYQHDVDQKELSHTLDGVVESVVNHVGVDVNTASPALLSYVAGIGPKLADRLVQYRDANGPFQSRNELLKVNGLGAKAFEQSAGFLRIRGGKNPLDSSAIHPESYSTANEIIKISNTDLMNSMEERKRALDQLLRKTTVKELAKILNTGELTLSDILDQLVKPGRDPRLDIPAPILRQDVQRMEDLSAGMKMKGTVRNVVDFGAFIDLGVKQDGLAHRSQIPPSEVLQVGTIVNVEILSVDRDRNRIALKVITSE